MVSAIQKWRPYLLGRHFIIKTYHQNLKYLLEQKISTPMQQKWMAKLIGYDYELQYKKGIDNIVADALSRKPEHPVQLCSLSTLTSPLLEEIQQSWRDDPELKGVIQKLEAGNIQDTSHYTWVNNQLRWKDKLIVGNVEALRQRIVSAWHDSAVGGHSGIQVTYKKLKAVLHWRKMLKDVIQYVSICDVYQRNKPELTAYPGLLQPLPIP